MAKYRQLHTQFWNDGFVLDLTPEEKYFYLYLMSNPKTSQCGVYELPFRVIEMETGYNRETVIKLLNRFKEYRKIQYCEETKEIMIINWVKYNIPNNPNCIKCVNREIKNIKNKDFIKILYIKYCELKLDVEKLFDGIFIVTNEENPLSRGLQGANKDIGSKEVINNKEEVISNKEEVVVSNREEVIGNREKVRSNREDVVGNREDVVNNKVIEIATAAAKDKELNNSSSNLEDVVMFFEKNIYRPKDLEYKKLKEWGSRINCDVIIMAIEEAVKYNGKNMQYIENVLYNWDEKNLKTKESVEDYKKQWKNNKKINGRNTDRWHLSNERQYDFKELERKLLG